MKVYKILDNVYILEEKTGCCSNLVVGKEKALVFDTGTGLENMYETIRRITDLELLVINSHGHFDHIGGNYLFENAYIHPLDYCLPSCFYKIEYTRRRMIDYYDQDNIADNKFTGRNWGNIKVLDFDCFDLGNLQCKVIHIPGHTKGSIGIFIPSLKILLSGDTLSPSICLNFPNAMTVRELMKTYGFIQNIEFNEYITSHHNHSFGKGYIDNLIKCCQMSIKEKGCKFISPLNPSYIGKLYIYCMKDKEYGECISIIY